MKKRKLKKVATWAKYLIGFTGHGPTALDVKPGRALGPREATMLRRMQDAMEYEQLRRQRAFAQAMHDVLGEDDCGDPLS